MRLKRVVHSSGTLGAFGTGSFLTRHPWKGAAQEPEVRVREPIHFEELDAKFGPGADQRFPFDSTAEFI
jgi:hypothetical protein